MSETITLGQARALLPAMAAHESLLLLSPPGIGKSDIVHAAAADAGLECRSLLGTQIAPEDVSGIPRIEGERAVFCPPRILLPEQPEPFCLFLDELPAASPDVQKAFYAVLLERRIGEHRLPAGTWVVAAGNRAEDRALVRTLSSALVNRVLILHLRVDHQEWLAWARRAGVRAEVMAFIAAMPEALMRPVPADPVPFSTPRGWARLSQALDLAEAAGLGDEPIRRALVFGKVTGSDAALFCAMAEHGIDLRPVADYLRDPGLLPREPAALWLVLRQIRARLAAGNIGGFGPSRPALDAYVRDGFSPENVDRFLRGLPAEARFTTLVGFVKLWGALGADRAMLDALREATGL